MNRFEKWHLMDFVRAMACDGDTPEELADAIEAIAPDKYWLITARRVRVLSPEDFEALDEVYGAIHNAIETLVNPQGFPFLEEQSEKNTMNIQIDDNDDDSDLDNGYCINCGDPAEEGYAYCKHCHQCWDCGATYNDSDDIFCEQCREKPSNLDS